MLSSCYGTILVTAMKEVSNYSGKSLGTYGTRLVLDMEQVSNCFGTRRVTATEQVSD